MREMYELILDVWTHTTTVPTREDYDLLLDGARDLSAALGASTSLRLPQNGGANSLFANAG